jgi:hypothetical protein
MPLIVKSVETAERKKKDSAGSVSFEEIRKKLRKPVRVKRVETPVRVKAEPVETNEKPQVVINGKVIEKPSRYLLDMLSDDQ